MPGCTENQYILGICCNPASRYKAFTEWCNFYGFAQFPIGSECGGRDNNKVYRNIEIIYTVNAVDENYNVTDTATITRRYQITDDDKDAVTLIHNVTDGNFYGIFSYPSFYVGGVGSTNTWDNFSTFADYGYWVDDRFVTLATVQRRIYNEKSIAAAENKIYDDVMAFPIDAIPDLTEPGKISSELIRRIYIESGNIDDVYAQFYMKPFAASTSRNCGCSVDSFQDPAPYFTANIPGGGMTLQIGYPTAFPIKQCRLSCAKAKGWKRALACRHYYWLDTNETVRCERNVGTLATNISDGVLVLPDPPQTPRVIHGEIFWKIPDPNFSSGPACCEPWE